MFCIDANNQILHLADGHESKLYKYARDNINASREIHDCGDENTRAIDFPTVFPITKLITK